MYKSGIIIVIFLLLSSFSSAEIYKWVDEDGNTYFTDTPPKNTKAKKLTLKITTYKSVKVIHPAKKITVNTGRRSEEKTVIMYSAQWCGVCRQAKRYFNEEGISYTDYDIDINKRARQEYKALNARGVPLIFIDETRLNGFSVKEFEHIYYQ